MDFYCFSFLTCYLKGNFSIRLFIEKFTYVVYISIATHTIQVFSHHVIIILSLIWDKRPFKYTQGQTFITSWLDSDRIASWPRGVHKLRWLDFAHYLSHTQPLLTFEREFPYLKEFIFSVSPTHLPPLSCKRSLWMILSWCSLLPLFAFYLRLIKTLCCLDIKQSNVCNI